MRRREIIINLKNCPTKYLGNISQALSSIQTIYQVEQSFFFTFHYWYEYYLLTFYEFGEIIIRDTGGHVSSPIHSKVRAPRKIKVESKKCGLFNVEIGIPELKRRYCGWYQGVEVFQFNNGRSFFKTIRNLGEVGDTYRTTGTNTCCYVRYWICGRQRRNY